MSTNSALDRAGDRYAYLDDGMRRWYIVTASDLADYVSYLDHEDEDIRGDAR